MDLLSAIQGVGDTIDKTTGGRAVRGLLAGKPRELLSPIPFSDTMGLTDSKDTTSGRDLTDAYGLTSKGDNSFGSHAAGFVADNLLSPGNLIGGYGAFKAAPTLAKGITAGAKSVAGLDLLDHVAGAGKSVGKFLGSEAGYLRVPLKGVPDELTDAADALGPMYSGGTEKLMRLADSMNDQRKFHVTPGHSWMNHDSFNQRNPLESDRIRRMASSEFGDRIAGEIPKGSRYLGNGAEAIAFRTPQGNVVRVADNSFSSGGRHGIPEILQPYRSAKIGPYTVEHLPFVNSMTGDHSDQMNIMNAMQERLRGRQYNPWDAGTHNIGVTKEGNYIIHDGGAVGDTIGHKARGTVDPYQWLPMPDDDLAARLIKLGAPKAVRNSIAVGASLGSSGQGVPGGDLLSALHAAIAGR